MMKSRHISRIVTWLSGIIIAVCSVGVPVTYFSLSYQHLVGSLETEVAVSGGILNDVINSNPELWEYERVRFEEYVSARTPGGAAEQRTITNLKNRVIAQSSPYLPSPRITRSVELMDAGMAVGILRISRSMRPLIVRSFVLLAATVAFGFFAFVVLKTAPLRAIAEQEKDLRTSEKRYRDLFANDNDAVFISDRDLMIEDVNSRASEVLGYCKPDLTGRNLLDVIPPAQRTTFRNSLENMTSDRASVRSEISLLTKDGSVRMVEAYSSFVASDDGPGRLRHAARDITDRKNMERELSNSREFIKGILDTVDEGFLVVDMNYRIVSANAAYCRQLNVPVEEVVGRHCYQVSHQDWRPCFETGEECAVRDVFERGRPSVKYHTHTDSDGSVIFVEIKAFPLRDAAGNIVSAIEVVNNITDKRLLDQQLLRTQKLEAMGLLAGGVAHDFNNLLQGIFGNISLARLYSDKEGKAFRMLGEVERALHIARKLTHQLLSFSKGGEPFKKEVSIPVLVRDAVGFVLSGSNVGRSLLLDDDVWPVQADEAQIGQVVQNIVINARDSMPEGGTVAIAVRNCPIDEENVTVLKAGRYVLITIGDTGYGIPDEHLPRIFDPYFTTKKRGLGLGLATSYSIVRNHGGVIDVESEVGRGSVFSIYLPASAGRHQGTYSMTDKILAGKGKVLLMDDEEVVRTAAGQMIEALGYDVHVVGNGEEAVAAFESFLRSGSPFDAVILDLTVRGGMGGRDAVQNMMAADPGVKAVVSSGYSDDPVLANYREYGFKALLSKPYELKDLSKTLHSLLAPDGQPLAGA